MRTVWMALSRLARRIERRVRETHGRRLQGEAADLLASLLAGEAEPSDPAFASDGVRELEHAARCFALNEFEREVVLLALAPELDARFGRLFGLLTSTAGAARPTVDLALSMLSTNRGRDLATFVGDTPLLRHGVIALAGDAPLASRVLVLAPDLVPLLAGAPAPAMPTMPAPSDVSAATALEIAAAIGAIRAGERPLVIVTGDRAAEIVAIIASELGAAIVSPDRAADDALRAAAQREAMWRGTPLVFAAELATGALEAIARCSAPPVIAAADQTVTGAFAATGRAILEVRTGTLDATQRAARWQRHASELTDDELAALGHRFHFDDARIATAVDLARSRARARGERVTAADVTSACRTVARAQASRLAARLDGTFELEDLVVPRTTKNELDLFEIAARRGHALFGAGTRGGPIRGTNGFAALFAGPPGTGKTMAAQIVARRLEIDLLRIDLSQVVDKYIGETEKRLDDVFRSAEASGAMLFFDEADALFGKRTQVKDAHDRYANIETAFLLQRIEQHPGIAVLATNVRNNLDSAFLRRLHFVIEFTRPAPAERREIWKRHLAHATLAPDVDLELLAKFELSGGDIRNAVVSAILFAHAAPHIEMSHLVLAVARELRKAGRLVERSYFGAWLDVVNQYAAA